MGRNSKSCPLIDQSEDASYIAHEKWLPLPGEKASIYKITGGSLKNKGTI